MPDGRPQALPTWIDTDGECLLVNTEPQRQRSRNVARDPRITVLIQKAERGLTAFVLVAVAVTFAVVAFFSFRQRRIRMLDQNPESLFENREILLGPAADRIADAVALGDVTRRDHERPKPPPREE
jgi:hypothetical protein